MTRPTDGDPENLRCSESPQGATRPLRAEGDSSTSHPLDTARAPAGEEKPKSVPPEEEDQTVVLGRVAAATLQRLMQDEKHPPADVGTICTIMLAMMAAHPGASDVQRDGILWQSYQSARQLARVYSAVPAKPGRPN